MFGVLLFTAFVPNSLSSDRYWDSAFQEALGTLGM
jgi:hypothetical protein